MVNGLGLGGGGSDIMDGKKTGNKDFDKLVNKCAKECYETFFKNTEMDYLFCDAGFTGEALILGIEPTYQFDPLKIIVVHRDKKQSKYVTGRAVEAWASRIVKTEKLYSQYKKQSKFVRFVDKWHGKIFPK